MHGVRDKKVTSKNCVPESCPHVLRVLLSSIPCMFSNCSRLRRYQYGLFVFDMLEFSIGVHLPSLESQACGFSIVSLRAFSWHVAVRD